MGGAIATGKGRSGDGFEFIMMRHAESVNNVRQRNAIIPGIFTRIDDPPITLQGQRQAQAAASRIHPFINGSPPPTTLEIFTSDMARTIETAMHVAKGLSEEMPTTRVCIVPLPFFNEMGSHTTVSEPIQERFSDTAHACGACLDGSLWRSSWQESQNLAGDYEACITRFISIVMPWVQQRQCRQRYRTLPIIVGHGQYMRHMLKTWKRFQNADLVRCRFKGGRIEFIEYIR